MRLVRRFTILTASLAAAVNAQTAPPPSTTGHALALVMAPLQVQCTAMQFGFLVPQHVATSATLPPDGGPLVDPSHLALGAGSQPAQASTCTASGDVGSAYHVMLAPSATLVNASGQGMVLDAFTVSSDGNPDPLNRSLHNNGIGLGTDSFGVGARLNVGADQPPGLYTGGFVVTVQYN